MTININARKRIAQAQRTHRPPVFHGYNYDLAKAIWDLIVAYIRACVPSLAHHTDYEIDLIFGSLRTELAEIIDEIRRGDDE